MDNGPWLFITFALWQKYIAETMLEGKARTYIASNSQLAPETRVYIASEPQCAP
jgi:hypothetical protein